MNRHSRLLFSAFLILPVLLSACSSTTQSYYQTIQLALKDRNVSFTLDEVTASNLDYISIKAGDRPMAGLVLFQKDGTREKWLSGDKIVVEMDNGIIVRTEGLQQDLIYTSNREANPLMQTGPLAYAWARNVDIKDIGYGIPVNSRWSVEGETTLDVFDRVMPVVEIVETVSMALRTPYYEPETEWQNRYWLDKSTHALLASEQRFSPQGDWYNMTFVTRAGRLIKEREGE